MLETVADVAQRFRLPLRTGPDGTDRPIRWTHISDLADPTPWLRGGELLLSLGLQLDPADSEQLDLYVRRLADAGIAALAFGTGARHETVPAALVDSARRHHLPVLEIPGSVAFQDITYQLNADLLRTGTAESRLVAESISAMTQVARSAGAQGVITTLAGRIDSWAVLMDRHGAVHAAVGAARVHIDDARAAALGQRSRIRHPDLIVHAVGDPVHPRAHLVVAARPDRKSLTRELAQHAAVLLDLALHPLSGGDVWGLARADAVDVLLSGDAASSSGSRAGGACRRATSRWHCCAPDPARCHSPSTSSNGATSSTCHR
ncbi:PucR family transcriptional regulator ligand-binding domain-containing protein [Sphaerisporangium sp. NPDC051017]|uniref:PucR family transcriptional regulator ligand-binding domain-containing protein n=1 Tax=Sphaerisporangium sp. NPDC051017 TaxID=3154636 RepID=UPI00342E505C